MFMLIWSIDYLVRQSKWHNISLQTLISCLLFHSIYLIRESNLQSFLTWHFIFTENCFFPVSLKFLKWDFNSVLYFRRWKYDIALCDHCGYFTSLYNWIHFQWDFIYFLLNLDCITIKFQILVKNIKIIVCNVAAKCLKITD